MSFDQNRRKEIELYAQDILESAYNGEEIKPPINLNKVLNDQGLTLYVDDFSSKNIAGAYFRKDGAIVIANNDYASRQAFTIAHEIGHHILHGDIVDEVFYRENLVKIVEEKATTEKEADYFAANLLMPKTLVLSAWKEQANKDVEIMAEIFGVSKTAMRWRLINLKLLNLSELQ